MIQLPPERPTDYKTVERTLAGMRSLRKLQAFYAGVIERFHGLDARFRFAASFDEAFVLDQLVDAWRMRERELCGVPFGVKDVFNTRVLPTSMGSEMWKGFSAGNNARVVDEIADRGGVVFCKTTTAEFAVHYIQAGQTLNPNDTGHITGTSSAGSAVAVACGALPICLGTQTAGSIVRPASFCGVYGFKPSFGAYDRTGALKTTDTLDTIGLLGSDIHGLRRVFSATFQKEPQYPIARNYAESLRRHQARRVLSIGVIADQFAGFRAYDSEVRTAFAVALEAMEDAGLPTIPVPDIDFINDIHALHQKIYCKSLSYYFQKEFSDESRMSQVMKRMIRLGAAISTDEYVEALRCQPQYRARFDAVIANYDFLVTPSTASVAPPVGSEERDDTCLIWTFLGYPVLSIPAFRTGDGRLPFGLQIVAPKFADLPLLEFGERVVGVLRRTGE